MNKIQSMMFPGLVYGTHESRHDLRILLYRGASKTRTDKVMDEISKGALGLPLQTRLPLVVAIYDVMTAQVESGMSHVSIKSRLYACRSFFSWCDERELPLELHSVETAFRDWVEFLVHRVRVIKNLSNLTAYRYANDVDIILRAVLGLRFGILATTRLRADTTKRIGVGSQKDKQNLQEAFTFGHFLMDVITYLTVDKMAGALPIAIPLRDGRVIAHRGGLENKKLEESHQSVAEQKRFLKRRAPIALEMVFTKRPALVNFRLEAEILVFVSQTGMNLSQAAKLKRGKFRFKSDGAETLVYRVYKGRRGGEAEFSIFKEYAPLFKNFIEWLDKLSPEDDDRLFPFVYANKIPSKGSPPKFQGIIRRCNALGIKFLGAQVLRKTRINWLLRKSRDPDLVAEMAQHTKQTLIQVYEEPHHQVAAVEISKFYRMTEPGLSSVGPGMCTSKIHPIKPTETSDGMLHPDCSTPAGCLFCEFQRDIDSEDYVWSLATFKYLKMLELDKYIPPEGKRSEHPIYAIIDRIQLKLEHFSATSEARRQWVDEASNRMREGRFHENYAGLIHLMEIAL